MLTSVFTGSAIVAFSAIPAASEASASGDDKWTYLGLVLTTLVAPIIVGIIFNRSLRPTSRNTENNNHSETVSTPGGNSFSIDGMPANMVEVLLSMWKKMEEMEDIQKTWAEEREEFIRINEELRRHNRALAEGFDEVIDWIDRGAVPPPPSVAQHVRELVQRAIENTGGLSEAN